MEVGGIMTLFKAWIEYENTGYDEFDGLIILAVDLEDAVSIAMKFDWEIAKWRYEQIIVKAIDMGFRGIILESFNAG